MTLRHNMERTVANSLRIYIGRLSGNIKLTLYKALIRSVMIYACPTWEYAAGAQLLKLQRLQNRFLRVTGSLATCTPVRELHVAFKIPYLYDYITELCSRKAEVILNHVIPNLHGTRQGEPARRKYTRLRSGLLLFSYRDSHEAGRCCCLLIVIEIL
jgi:hypothetical protein